MFGDKEKFIDKFKTCARCRVKDEQTLGEEFYCKEHTKTLFKAHNIMTVHNIYNYQCFMQTFKILKFRMPISIYSKFSLSKRKETLLLTPSPSTNFLYRSSILWNSLRKSLDIFDFSANIDSVRSRLKSLILFNQHSQWEGEWTDNNFVL